MTQTNPISKSDTLYFGRMLWLMLIASVVLAAGLGLRDPSPPDEPRFALAAQHMVHSGDWLIPHRGSEFYAEKPPVFMWMQAAFGALIGNWKIAFLLPSLFAGLATLWLTYDLARRLYDPKAGFYAASALWVCLQFGLQAKRGQIDMVLVFLTTLSLWGLLRHLLHKPSWKWLMLGAFAAGVGTVTKGVGFLPLLVFIPWLWVRTAASSTAQQNTAWQWAWLPVGFFAGTAIWLGPLAFALQSSADPAVQQYAQELLFKQTGERYANPWHHIQPAWYYVQVICTLWLPSALLLPWLIPSWAGTIRKKDPTQLILIGWSMLVLLFFTASPAKREVYIFPMLPALCIAAAPFLSDLLKLRKVQWALRGYLMVISVVLTALGLCGLFEWNPWAIQLASEREIDADALRSFLLWLTAAGIAGVFLFVWGRLQRIGPALIAFTAVLWTVYGVGLAPALDATSSAKSLMQRVGRTIGPNAELGMIAWREQNLLQADRVVTDFGFKQPWDMQWRRAQAWARISPERRWLFVLEDALSPCVDANSTIAIGASNRRNWVLVPATAIRQRCITPKAINSNYSAE